METVSKKRGRPRKYIDRHIEHTSQLFPELTTKRQTQSRYLAQIALELLVEGGEVIDGVDRLLSVESNTFRVGVMEQLGRLWIDTEVDEPTFREIAVATNRLFVDDAKMTTRKAAQIVRIVRMDAMRSAAEQN